MPGPVMLRVTSGRNPIAIGLGAGGTLFPPAKVSHVPPALTVGSSKPFPLPTGISVPDVKDEPSGAWMMVYSKLVHSPGR
jgi:hypothetical protein